jgi:hypothetical protein
MDLLISMKAEPIEKGLEPRWSTMSTPAAQTGGYFMAEFREGDQEKLRLLIMYAEILRSKLDGEEFQIELTQFGFILKKKVDQDVEYIKAWDSWVEFSRSIYEKLVDILEGSD